MYTLIAFATQWGSKFGGINSFNTDFLSAFGVAFHGGAKVICIVATASEEEIREAENSHVTLAPLPYPPQEKRFTAAQAQTGVEELKRRGINFDPAKTVWLGHDLISGAAANESARIAGGRSALIHHMSYGHYEAFAENSTSAYEKMQQQTDLFRQADLVLAVGPLLRDALNDRLGGSIQSFMLIPGMAEIDLLPAPKTFTVFLSGRLSDNAARIKQGHLGIAAFAQAHCNARKIRMPDGLCRQPKLILRGVDFEGQGQVESPLHENPETELKRFAQAYADAVINLHALPYTHDRQALYNDLRGASAALMPSWHEGFGLVAWEAIAAGVPLVISENSGVYHFLEEKFPGAGPGCVFPVNIRGVVDEPFFHSDDLKAVVTALTTIANKPDEARRKAGQLRNMLGQYTWSACAEQTAEAFHWCLQKGSVPTEILEQLTADIPLPVILPSVATRTPISPLQMPSKQWQAGSGMADSQLLRAEEAQVPFDPARQPELQAALDWRDDQRWPQAVRLITGAGGVGKTRLALELCQQSLAAGWQAGFLDNDCTVETMATGWQTLSALGQPLLFVIDYAETRQPTLLALIRAILKNPGVRPARILLLARNGGEWWDNLPGLDPQCEALLSGYATSGPFCLPLLYVAASERRQAYGQALQAFAQSLNVSAPAAIPELTGEHFGRPLFLQMAALLALHGERPTTAEGLTRALLNHERRYWRRLLAKTSLTDPERHAQQLLALATLAGGFTSPAQAKPYWTTANAAGKDSVDLAPLFHALAPLYPGKQGLQAVRPDLLGEALVGQSLLQPGVERLLDAVLGDNAAQAVRRHALTVLSRLSYQRPDMHEVIVQALMRHFGRYYQDILAVATETVGSLPLLAEIAFTRLALASKSQLAGLLSPRFQEESLQLAGLACAVSGFLTEKTKQKFLKKKSTECMADYAGALGNYAVDLYRTGRNDKALDAAQKAFALFQQLYGKNQQRFAPHYAGSLNNLTSHLSEAGQYDQALELARQALEICKRLAENNPDRFDPDYAMSLNNLANRLSEAGQYDQALDLARQALEIYKRLAENNPDRFDPDYAMSLNNLANHLKEAGQYDQAFDLARQALEIYKRLAENNPDRFDSDYAMSLNNLANRLREAGQYDQALELARQALEIRNRLAENNPDRFDPDYAMSLDNLATYLSEAGQYGLALDLARQALEMRKRLAENNPDRFDPDYARSLNNLATHLSEAGQYGLAHDLARQALEIYKRLAENNPDRFDPDYAGSLNNFANRLSDAGQYEQALDPVHQALEIHQRLVAKCSARFAADSFSVICHGSFLQWLANPLSNEDGAAELPAIPTTARPHHRLRLQLFRKFVDMCWLTEQTAREEGFKQVATEGRELLLIDRNQIQEFWLCAAAWCATFAPEAVEKTDWQAVWKQFNDQRQGAVPIWMRETAQRLSFQWPRDEG